MSAAPAERRLADFPARGPDGTPKLAVVISHPTQYYSPWFRWIAAHTNINLRVFYLWNFGVTDQRDPKFETTFRWDVDLLSGYKYEFLPNIARDAGTHHFFGLHNPSLPKRLAAWQPEVLLLFGYNWASHGRAIAWARLHRVPLLFRGDSHFLGRGIPRLPVRILLRALYRQFSAVLPVGAANAEYFDVLGVPRRKQHFAPHSVDSALFNPADVHHQNAAAHLRAQLGLTDETRVLLYAGKFVPEKQPIALLEAFLTVSIPNTALVFVGDGPEKAPLVARTAAARTNAVHFLPFANQTEMPSRYLLADVFALPSRGFYETWGLAVNEAMHMGVPALVSDRVGCHRDLVSDDITGWSFPAEDFAALVWRVAHALSDVRRPERRVELRASVIERISGYTYSKTTAGLLAAIGTVFPSHGARGMRAAR